MTANETIISLVILCFNIVEAVEIALQEDRTESSTKVSPASHVTTGLNSASCERR